MEQSHPKDFTFHPNIFNNDNLDYKILYQKEQERQTYNRNKQKEDRRLYPFLFWDEKKILKELKRNPINSDDSPLFYLNISQTNRITSLKYIGENIGTNPYLINLQIDFSFYNDLTLEEEDAEILSTALETNTSLQYLTLSHLHSLNALRSITYALTTNKTLLYLNINHTSFLDKSQDNPHDQDGSYIDKFLSQGSIYIAYLLAQNEYLQYLILFSDDITTGGMSFIADALKKNSSLTFLSLSNNLYMANTRAIANMLFENRTLQSLNLNGTFIKDKEIISIAQALEHNSSLKQLDLVGTRTENTGYQAIVSMLTKNTTLRELQIGISRDIPDETVIALFDIPEKNYWFTYLRDSHFASKNYPVESQVYQAYNNAKRMLERNKSLREEALKRTRKYIQLNEKYLDTFDNYEQQAIIFYERTLRELYENTKLYENTIRPPIEPIVIPQPSDVDRIMYKPTIVSFIDRPVPVFSVFLARELEKQKIKQEIQRLEKEKQEQNEKFERSIREMQETIRKQNELITSSPLAYLDQPSHSSPFPREANSRSSSPQQMNMTPRPPIASRSFQSHRAEQQQQQQNRCIIS